MFQDLKPYEDYAGQEATTSPAHWERRSLGSLLTQLSERDRPDLPLLSVARERGVFVRSADDANHNVIPDDLTNYKVARRGNLVINKMKAWQGSMGIAPVDGVVSPAYFVYDLAIENLEYAHLLLRSKPYVAKYATASDGVRVGQWDLVDARFRRIPVALPPVEEQKAIVTYLAHAHQRINKAIATKRRMLSLLGEQERAIVRETVRRGRHGGALRESGLGWLGPVPENWGVVALRYLARLGNGSTPSRANLAYWTSGSYPWLNSSVVNQGIVRHVDQFVTKQALSECHLPIVAPGSVLIGITGQGRTRGMAALLESEATINQHLAYVTPDSEKLRSDYLVLVLKAAYSELRRISSDSGSTKGALTVADLKAFRVPMPPLAEQEVIVADAERQVAATRALVSRVEQEITLLEEFRTRLTADVVTGQVDVRSIAASLPSLELAAVFAASAGAIEDDETAEEAGVEDE